MNDPFWVPVYIVAWIFGAVVVGYALYKIVFVL